MILLRLVLFLANSILVLQRRRPVAGAWGNAPRPVILWVAAWEVKKNDK